APPDRKIEVEQATDKDPFTRLHFPIFINSVYFGSMILVCSQKSYSKGLEDLFAILSKRIASVCDSIWKQQVQIESPHHFFFTRLLNGEKVTNSYTQIQMSRTAIPQNGQLKLLLVELDDKSRIRRLPQITEAASRINHGDCYHFVYRGDLLILCYAEEGDSQLSHRKSYNDLNRLIYKAFDVPSSASQIFENITDIDMAYKQAKVSLGLKNTIKSELFATGEKQNMGVYLFEDALLYYLIDPSEMDKRFLEFSFSHTVLQKIYAEDQQNGTNNLALFWFYLHHERNATAVAQRLHMHRNTVLYHIDKIQKRFDFDLSLQSAREKMLVDFKTFFLRSNHESVEKIFADTREDTDEHLTL
ncbi:MAG: helix-turn-helix domain-containing protein, partial [Raoultibacter sp.]